MGGRSAGAGGLPHRRRSVPPRCWRWRSPLHPPGKPEDPRRRLLVDLPLCVVQGQRDPFGRPESSRRAWIWSPSPATAACQGSGRGRGCSARLRLRNGPRAGLVDHDEPDSGGEACSFSTTRRRSSMASGTGLSNDARPTGRPDRAFRGGSDSVARHALRRCPADGARNPMMPVTWCGDRGARVQGLQVLYAGHQPARVVVPCITTNATSTSTARSSANRSSRRPTRSRTGKCKGHPTRRQDCGPPSRGAGRSARLGCEAGTVVHRRGLPARGVLRRRRRLRLQRRSPRSWAPRWAQ